VTPVRRTPWGAQVATLNSGRSTRHPGRGMTTGSAFGPPGAPGVADHRGFVTGESPTSSHRGPSDVAGALIRPRCAWPDCAGIGVRLRRALPVGPPARPAAQRSGLPCRPPPIEPRYFRPTGAALGKQSWSGRPPPPLLALERSSAPDGPGNGAGHLSSSSSRFGFGFGTGSVPMTTSSRTSSRASATSSRQPAGVAGVGGRG
jgi:hypothetical protein